MLISCATEVYRLFACAVAQDLRLRCCAFVFATVLRSLCIWYAILLCPLLLISLFTRNFETSHLRV